MQHFSRAMDDFVGEGDFRADDSLYRSRDPSLPPTQHQYGSIGRGYPPGRGRSMSINPTTLPNTIANIQSRSRSTHLPNIHDVSGPDAPIRMGDLESLLERFSMQQEERHREQTRELKEQTVSLQARITSLEKCSHPTLSHSLRGPATRGGGVPNRQRALRASNPVILPEVVEGGDSVGAVLEGEDADDEEDEGEPSTLKKKTKPKYHTAIQRYSTQAFRAVCGVKGRDWPDPEVIRTNPTTGVKYLTLRASNWQYRRIAHISLGFRWIGLKTR
ncbi:hypothetical protein C8R44DRAFT_974368 [Mycena epipterygia]|nr:hypothetical protein C8R44DRAFT_974368 [Mycena epipterygia]